MKEREKEKNEDRERGRERTKKERRERERKRILIFFCYICGKQKRYFILFSEDAWIKLNMFFKAVRPSYLSF